MKEKILKIVTVITLILTLTSLNVLFLGYHIVIALADELEAQNNNTNIADVTFDAYFKTDSGNMHYRQANISDNQVYLYVQVSVLEKGSLDNAKIKIDDANFKIKDNNYSNSYIKSINKQTNEIQLNSVIYNNNVELEIPIEFDKKDTVNAQYFSKESTVQLTGTYKEEEKEEQLEGSKIVKLEWTDNTDVTISQNVEKFVDLGENGILMQQQITSTVENGSLPRETEQLKINVPKINNLLPNTVEVLSNGKKLEDSNIQYNQDAGQVTITKQSNTDAEGNTTWNSDINEYKVIYIYDKAAKEEINAINLQTEINTKLFTKENIQKINEQEVNLEFKGNIVSVNKQTTPEVYKGYLYANSANETIYRENNIIEISNAEVIDTIKANTTNSYFIGNQERQYDANQIHFYKETQISKNRFIELFGENGYINIKDEAENVIGTINKDSQVDENGNIKITYAEPKKGIIIETSKPVEEGQFTIHNIKYIQGNTGYTRNQLKEMTQFTTNEVVETNLGKDETQATINLLDTKTEATLEMNNTNLSTLQKNENVQFTITLKTSSEKYDLFKNPVIEITLPNGISNIDVKSVNTVYADAFNIEYARLGENHNGQKIMQIALSGEQTDYANQMNELSIVINADIEFTLLTPSQKSSVTMSYTNENGNDSSYQTAVEINIQSKPGMMIYSNLVGYNQAGESVYTIDNNVPVGILDIEAGSREVNVNTAIINNYDIEINDVAIIGRIPKKDAYDGTIDTTLLEGIHTNLNGVEILYSQSSTATKDDTSWTQDYTNASSYMIKLDKMTPGQAIAIQYTIQIPENVGYGQTMYAQTDTTYTYLGNVNTQTSKVGARSENLITNNISALSSTIEEKIGNGLNIELSTISGGTELGDGDSVYEGQKILYTMKITNSTGKDLKNVHVKATQTNGNIYGLVEEEAFDPVLGEESLKTYHRYDELNTNVNEFATIESLANGESTVISYEIVVSEVEGEEKQTYGDIQITADDMEDANFSTIKNTIKQAELKLTMSNSFYEEEKIYTGMNVHMNLKIENISGTTLQNLKGTIKLPDTVYCKKGTDLIWEQTTIGDEEGIEVENKLRNLVYDEASNTLTFEMASMEPEEVTQLELYFQLKDTIGKEEDISFMYQMEGSNVYVSNLATMTVHNEKRDMGLAQTASISDDTKLKDEDIFDLTILVENKSDEELNFGVFDTLPKGFTAKSAKLIYQNQEEEIPIVDKANQDENREFEIYNNALAGEKLLAGNTNMQIVITIEIDAEWITEETITNTVDMTYGKLSDEDDYYQYVWHYGMTLDKQFYMQSKEEAENWVEVVQTSSPENNATLEDGQNVTYTVSIRNTKNYEITVTLYDYLPKGLVVESVTLDGTQLEAGDIYVEGHKIGAGEVSTLEITGHVEAIQVANGEMLNNLTVSTVAGNVVSNDIIYKVNTEETPVDPDDPNPDNPDPDDPNPDNPDPDNPNPDNPGGEETYTISGTAWIDSNKDGKRDSEESLLSGIGVSVLNANDGTYVEGINTTTSASGHYEINVTSGNYILVFTYNTQMYKLTEYRKQGVAENENSDVINKTITINGQNSTVGATDTININSSNVESIDIGLTEVSTFDLELNKYVSEIVVQTNKSTTKYGYNNQNLVKVEIPAKEINNATVIIKYAIQITNVGEIAGYVQNIVDYIPSDLSFSSELNKDWYQANSNLQNNSLSNVAIEPGQTQTVELVLVKTVTGDNTGTIINTAEIEEASNSLEISDTDSTPGNNNASEDDYGRAEVIISVGTGRMVVFISIIMTILVVTAVTVVIINKKVLKNDDLEI